jgi:outer membrane protein insertion porin family
MKHKKALKASYFSLLLLLVFTGCNTTRHLKEGEYLLRKTSVKIESDRPIKRKGEMKENLERLVAQKPNSRQMLGLVPYKLTLYNIRYEKYQKDSANFQLKSKTVEAPVIYDSLQKRRTAVNMKGYLFHSGYFYAVITDTTKFTKKKAYVDYNVYPGVNYFINKTELDVDDPAIREIIDKVAAWSVLKTGEEFSYDLLEREQGRITTRLRDVGYFRFTNDNVTFVLDSVNKRNPADSAKGEQPLKLDIRIVIRPDNPKSFMRYGINRITVFPDFRSSEDFRDTTMRESYAEGIRFRYHDYYIREKVIARHMFLAPQTWYSQTNYDQTIANLNNIGVFQTIRISYREDTTVEQEGNWLNAAVYLTPADKLDFSTSFDISNAVTYDVGSGVTLGLRNHNFAKGANFLSSAVTGSVETLYDTVQKKFRLSAKSISTNVSIEFPKFLLPVAQNKIRPRNMPRTVIGAGWSLFDRERYFTLISTSANFVYRWRETEKKSWEVSPVFVNIVNLPRIDTVFQKRLDTNAFLRRTYTKSFIEGENASFIYSDREKKGGRNYSYVKISLEEAGALMSAIDLLIDTLNYSKYVKFDADMQHFFTWLHSSVALRLYGGIGMAYDTSNTLPYLKQYFAGGPFSMRGWQQRSLGPGSYFNPSDTLNSAPVDRTGDIKLELNAEYRFDILKLFGGNIKVNGAVFADAGNIWFRQRSPSFPNGEFSLDRFGKEIAVNGGVGVRIDVAGFLLVRIDPAIPLKDPVVTNYQPFARNWVKNKIIWNIALGYPF